MISRRSAVLANSRVADAVRILILIVVLSPVLVGPVQISTAQPDSTRRPVVGLVLSGGSARGLAHVGVLKVLEREGIPIDVVTGTSMGALVGGLYALGYNASDLETVALEQDWDGLFSDRISRRSALLERRTASRGVMVSVPFKGTEVLLPSGLLSGQRIMTTLSRLTWGYHDLDDLAQLDRPFTAVATHLRSGEARALTNQPLATAMRASISLPSVFRPVRIDGQLYIDGGVARNIPAIDALELGADFLIAVDVGEALDSTATERLSFLDVLVETAFFQAARLDEAQRQLVDVLIQPDVSGLTRASFADAAEWIRRGEAAAEAALPQLRQLAGLSPLRDTSTREAVPEQAFISEIIVRGVHDGGIELVHARLKLEERTWLTPDEIEDAIGRVFGTGLFDEVTYRVVPHPRPGGGGTRTEDGAGLEDALLDIVVVPSDAPNRIGVGFRYDSRYKSAILLDATIWGVDVSNAVTAVRARFGDQLSLSASYSARSGRRSRFNLGARGGYADAPVDVYMPRRYMTALGFSPDVPLFAVSLGTVSTDLIAAFASRESLRTGARVRMAHVFVEDRVAGRRQSPDTTNTQTPVPLLVTRDQDFASAGAFVEFDTLDDLDFPTRGAIVSASGEMGISNAQPFVGLALDQGDGDAQPNAGPFLFIAAKTNFAVPVAPSVAIHGRGAFVYGSGAHLPSVYYTYLGGRETVTVLGNAFVSMYGLQAQERFGRAGFLGDVGVQWEARTGLFAKASINIGDTWDPLGADNTNTLSSADSGLLDESISIGVGLELAIRTRVGPVRLVAAIGDRDEPVNLGFQFGFDF